MGTFVDSEKSKDEQDGPAKYMVIAVTQNEAEHHTHTELLGPNASLTQLMQPQDHFASRLNMAAASKSSQRKSKTPFTGQNIVSSPDTDEKF